MDNDRKKMIIERRVCMVFPVRARSVFTIRSFSVSSKLFSWVSVNVGKKPDKPVLFKPVIKESAISPICSSLLISSDAASDATNRMRRRTQTVRNVADTEGFTILLSRL